MKATAPAPAMQLSEVCAALGFSRRTFYDRAEKGDDTVTFLLERCMGGNGKRRRWDPRDVEAAKQMERA